MAFSVQMPALGESVTEGTVTRWLKQQGDRVEVGEPLLEVSTDKVDTEIPSPVAGTVLEMTAGEDEVVKVGGQLAVIGDAAEAGSGSGDSAGSEAAEPPAGRAAQDRLGPQPEPGRTSTNHRVASAAPVTPSFGTADPYITPLVRKLAAQHGVDLATVAGTGTGGRIRKQDLLAAVERAAPEPQPAAASRALSGSPPTP